MAPYGTSPAQPGSVKTLREELASLDNQPPAARNTGDHVNYYLLEVKNPKRLEPYTAECEDIIEALGMNFAEGCAFKALWRRCAAKKLGVMKANYDGPAYDGEKTAYYAQRMVAQDKLVSLGHQIVGLTESSTGLAVDHVAFHRK